jgi:hypothetical protein
VLICGIDPGTASPGFAVWETESRRFIHVGRFPWPGQAHAAAVEAGQVHGKAGKLQMWGLGWIACVQMRSVKVVDESARFSVKPDAWRVALGLNPRYPKDVCVNRLRLRYRHCAPEGATDDMIEAMGIAEGSAIILGRPLKKDRKGLTAVTI